MIPTVSATSAVEYVFNLYSYDPYDLSSKKRIPERRALRRSGLYESIASVEISGRQFGDKKVSLTR